jgi:hypothetical protein
LEKCNVLEIMSNMGAKTKEIGGPNGLERLLKYYVKLAHT